MTLSATDECVALIHAAAEPLPRARRPAFYERVSALLRNDEILIPHRVQEACRQVQNEFLIAPVEPPRSPTDAPPLSPYKRRAR
jgi:hypothetical protein